MALQIQNVPVTSVAQQVAILPPNSAITFSIATGGGQAFIGLSSAVTTANGFAVSPGVPHTFGLAPTSQFATVWAIAASGTVPLGVIVTTTA